MIFLLYNIDKDNKILFCFFKKYCIMNKRIKKLMDMLEELDKLVLFIEQKYNEIQEEWKQNELYKVINQKKQLVKDINNNSNILNTILSYRAFINEKSLDLKLSFDILNVNGEISTRVKTQNSIEFKIKNYMSKEHEYGRVPINKCFNDLYGIRIIFNETMEYNKIKQFIESKYQGRIKCIDSSKLTGYIATHIYFKTREDNYSFVWELQIWDKLHEKNNIILHEQYKQEYTNWEKENKEGG